MVSIPERYTFENFHFPHVYHIIAAYGISFELLEEVGESHVWVLCLSPGKEHRKFPIRLRKILLAKKLLKKV